MSREPKFGAPFYHSKIQERTGKEYEENNEHSAGWERNAGEIIQENDGIPEKSRTGSQQKENEPAHDQKGVIAYDEQKRFF